MATTIKWIDNNNNKIETAHRIYKSSTYFTKDNLPAPLVELGADVTEYVDSAGTDGENWYIVSALLNDYEVFSEPFISGLTTVYTHDIFNDGSAVATYNFDGDATDLGGTYNGTWSGTESYVGGVIGQAADFSDSDIITPVLPELSGDASYTLSFWVFDGGGTNGYGLISIGSFLSGKGWGDYSGPIGGIGWDLFSSSTTDTPEGILSSNRWDHVVISYPGNKGSDCINHVKIYVNSVDLPLTVTRDAGVVPDITNPSVNINNYTSNFRRNLPIDQLRIFNRALTQQEVDNLYQEGAAYL